MLRQTVGGILYLDFDGIDDCLEVPVAAWTPAGTSYAIWLRGGGTNPGRFVCSEAGNGKDIRTFLAASPTQVFMSASTSLGNTVASHVSGASPYNDRDLLYFYEISHDGVNTDAAVRAVSDIDESNIGSAAGVMITPNFVRIARWTTSYDNIQPAGPIILRAGAFSTAEQDQIISYYRSLGAAS